ncbi:MAG: MoxR family ATPase [Candidatus Woesearchaeota archaeon]
MASGRISEKLRPKLMEEDPFTDILGQEKVKRGLKSALLMGRNILIIGPAGVGKTTLAKNVAKLLPKTKENAKGAADEGSRFVRLQGSPDLTVEDILGDIDPVKALKYGPTSTEAFTKGKLFRAHNGVLFFDELNRCPEKLQNALLQVLEEGKATIGSYDVDFDVDFIFIGTMNPEDSSTEKLSDVLLDRFDALYMTYPESIEIESSIIRMKGRQIAEASGQLVNTISLFVRTLRESKDLEMKPSVRASIGLYERAQSNAVVNSRKEASFDDVRDVAVSVLAHRIKLKPSLQYLKSPEDFIKEEMEKFVRQKKELIEPGKGGSL